MSDLATKNDLAVVKSEQLPAIAESNKDTLKGVIGMIMGSVLINVATMIALVTPGALTKIAALFPPRGGLV